MNTDIALQSAVHYSSIAVYVLAVVLGLDAVRHLFQSSHPPIIKELIAILLASCVLLCIAFVGMQTYWVTALEFNDISDAEALGWLIHDWVNGISHLSFVVSVRVFILWNQLKLHGTTYRRISDTKCAVQPDGECKLRTKTAS